MSESLNPTIELDVFCDIEGGRVLFTSRRTTMVDNRPRGRKTDYYPQCELKPLMITRATPCAIEPNFANGTTTMNATWLAKRLGRHRLLAAALTGVTLSISVQAVELPSEHILPLDLATKAAIAALNVCQGQGYKVSVAIVDRSGVLKVLVRADGAGPHTVDSSRRKAYTASSLRRATQELAELVASRPETLGLRDMNESILILGGGLPISIDGEVVGGIGVGGAPGAKLDEACARAGLTEIGAH